MVQYFTVLHQNHERNYNVTRCLVSVGSVILSSQNLVDMRWLWT